MKFLCDRCKTRYSIADERVRGKILKIRCKNCANVITVREGMMADPEAAPPPEYAGRTKKSTTAAPEAMSNEAAKAIEARRSEAARAAAGGAAAKEAAGEPAKAPAAKEAAAAKDAGRAAAKPAGQASTAAAGGAAAKRSARSDEPAPRSLGQAARSPSLEPAPSNALGAAFASAMAKPPPAALQEEWYVSIDGEQSGPFSLADAQRWVAQKPFDAELHCWSEGFDDWLPVDKVSHFRGLRKRPAPLPRIAAASRTPAPAPAPAAPAAEEPKPLFAATMASLERAAAAAPSAGLQPPATSARATPPLGTPVAGRGEPAKPTNGARLRDTGPGSERRENGSARGAAAPSPAKVEPKPAARGSVLDAPFDTSDDADSGEIEPTLHREPIVSARPAASSARATSPTPASSAPAGGVPQATDASPTAPHQSGAAAAASGLRTDGIVREAASDFESAAHGGDDLDIGEVSRVVNLADIIKGARTGDRSPRTTERPAGGRSGSFGRVTNANASLRTTGPMANMRTTGGIASMRGTGPATSIPAAPGAGAIDEPAPPVPPAVTTHRRGLIALLSVAAVMVLGGVAAVLFIMTPGDEPTGSLGPVRNIDTSRPEDPITHRPIEPNAGSAATTGTSQRVPPRITRPLPPTGSGVGTGATAHEPEAPPADGLRSDEIEDMARKHQDMTQRCYQRVQRGADAILIGDVKKITVTLTVDKDGNVADLQLSDHSADNLGKCLTSSIRGWKFRQSGGGTYQISLAFAGG